VTVETLYLFLALAVLAALGIWLNLKAADNLIIAISFAMVLPGIAGMVYLVAAALLGGAA